MARRIAAAFGADRNKSAGDGNSRAPAASAAPSIVSTRLAKENEMKDEAACTVTVGEDFWTPHKTRAYVRTVVDTVQGGGRVRMKLDKPIQGESDFIECHASSLLACPASRACVPNMDELPELNMAEVLENVDVLYKRKQPASPGLGWSSIYSSVGPVLIAMNPFVELPLYGDEWTRAFRNAGQRGAIEHAWRTLGPHCYWTVERAYQGLRADRHQSVVICGESGAGKTVTNRKMLEYLLEAETKRQEEEQGFNTKFARLISDESVTSLHSANSGGASSAGGFSKQKHVISEVNDLLEAFGNAKTLRNDNSSRFGKYSQLHFDADTYKIAGFEIEHYLLERSRVVYTPSGERNYHIFHFLMASPLAAELGLAGGSEAAALTRVGANVTRTDGDSFDDLQQFDLLCQKMAGAGFSKEDRTMVFEAVAAVAHLSNIKFAAGSAGAQDSSQIEASSQAHLQKACALLKTDGLGEAMITLKTTGKAEYTKNVSLAQARSQRDAVAKFLYSRIFDYLLNKLNNELIRRQRLKTRATIGLLDIFGFEDMPLNGLEQIFINLTNERIQYLFNQVMFERELEAYKKEGIERTFEWPSNWPCVELFISKSPVGIVGLLSDQCKAPAPDPDKAFLGMLNDHMHDHSHFKRLEATSMKAINESKKVKWGNLAQPMDYSECFQIRHYAGNVVYIVRDFVEKSKDTLPQHLEDALRACKNPCVASLEIENARKTVGEKFVKQLQLLADKLDGGSSLFVRCIKPNPDFKVGVVDRPFVLEQLINGGVVAALEMRKAGYPDRMGYREFCDEFWLLEGNWRLGLPPRKLTEDLLEHLIGDNSRYAFGHSKIFMRHGVVDRLRSELAVKKSRFAVLLQRRWRLLKSLELISRAKKAKDKLDQAIRESAAAGLSGTKPVRTMREKTAIVQLVWDGLNDYRVNIMDIPKIKRAQRVLAHFLKEATDEPEESVGLSAALAKEKAIAQEEIEKLQKQMEELKESAAAETIAKGIAQDNYSRLQQELEQELAEKRLALEEISWLKKELEKNRAVGMEKGAVEEENARIQAEFAQHQATSAMDMLATQEEMAKIMSEVEQHRNSMSAEGQAKDLAHQELAKVRSDYSALQVEVNELRSNALADAEGVALLAKAREGAEQEVVRLQSELEQHRAAASAANNASQEHVAKLQAEFGQHREAASAQSSAAQEKLVRMQSDLEQHRLAATSEKSKAQEEIAKLQSEVELHRSDSMKEKTAKNAVHADMEQQKIDFQQDLSKLRQELESQKRNVSLGQEQITKLNADMAQQQADAARAMKRAEDEALMVRKELDQVRAAALADGEARVRLAQTKGGLEQELERLRNELEQHRSTAFAETQAKAKVEEEVGRLVVELQQQKDAIAAERASAQDTLVRLQANLDQQKSLAEQTNAVNDAAIARLHAELEQQRSAAVQDQSKAKDELARFQAAMEQQRSGAISDAGSAQNQIAKLQADLEQQRLAATQEAEAKGSVLSEYRRLQAEYEQHRDSNSAETEKIKEHMAKMQAEVEQHRTEASAAKEEVSNVEKSYSVKLKAEQRSAVEKEEMARAKTRAEAEAEIEKQRALAAEGKANADRELARLQAELQAREEGADPKALLTDVWAAGLPFVRSRLVPLVVRKERDRSKSPILGSSQAQLDKSTDRLSTSAEVPSLAARVAAAQLDSSTSGLDRTVSQLDRTTDTVFSVNRESSVPMTTPQLKQTQVTMATDQTRCPSTWSRPSRNTSPNPLLSNLSPNPLSSSMVSTVSAPGGAATSLSDRFQRVAQPRGVVGERAGTPLGSGSLTSLNPTPRSMPQTTSSPLPSAVPRQVRQATAPMQIRPSARRLS